MVVWLFAGGGNAEIEGLVPFLEKHFPTCVFVRQTPPKQKPGPKPTKTGYGRTSRSLAQQIKERLADALQWGICDLILVIDDLDCRDAQQQKTLFLEATNSALGEKTIKCLVGFAAPELEAWLVADWDNTFARNVYFRASHQGMRRWLSQEKKVPFDAPESFSSYDPAKGSCAEKLSECIIQASLEFEAKMRFSKGTHTPELLRQLNPVIVSQKCPLFRELYHYLHEFCQP